MDIIMGRVRATAAVCAVGLGMVAASCSGDGGEQVLRTDGDTAPVAFEAAIRETFTGTGRYTFTMDDDDSSDARQTGEFAGGATKGTVTWEDEDPTTVLIVDDVSYIGVDEGTADWWAVDPSALEGKQWIRTTPTPEELAEMELPEGVDPEIAAGMMAMDPSVTGDASAPQILSQLDRILSRAQDVRADGTADVGGRTLDRFVARLGGDEMFELYGGDVRSVLQSSALMWGDEGGPLAGDVEDRLTALSNYVDDHVGLELTVLADGTEVARVDMRVTSTVDPQYEDCTFLDVSSGPDTMTFEFTDLGAPITLAAPDPSTVISSSDLDELFEYDDSFEQVGGAGGDSITTSDGEWTRDEIEEWVIDDAARLGVDPVTVPGLPQDQLVALYERSLVLDGPLLETEWDGEMPRSEIVATVLAGADRIGLDPATVPTMSDADLVAAYDEINELRYGPMDEDDVGAFPEDLFEGCPG
ncbi:hypothetical protein [Dermatobacter hominis]|uniref:hypothetical protein n=1 Tax=Dermatobacter hominis TaxID=2884263 RepID=UPI001D104473|nr:hypothetical protein [Dermatobacter hominis]UDY34588.1 hypothetical protein LH044_14745 [Dermatobacter hominis]